MNQINKFGESLSSGGVGGGGGGVGGASLKKYILNRQEKTDIDLNSLRQSINILKSKIITLETNLQSEVSESANLIKLALEDYSQDIYTKYIERLEENIQRLEDVLFKLLSTQLPTDEVKKIKVQFPIVVKYIDNKIKQNE